jgi:hypothetical protein
MTQIFESEEQPHVKEVNGLVSRACMLAQRQARTPLRFNLIHDVKNQLAVRTAEANNVGTFWLEVKGSLIGVRPLARPLDP